MNTPIYDQLMREQRAARRERTRRILRETAASLARTALHLRDAAERRESTR